MRGLGRNHWLSWIFLMKYLSICSVIVKSAITPSFMGRMAVMLPGVRPSICLAARPTAWMVFLPLGPPSWRIATTEGSSRTIPLPRTYISVLAVPRSIAMSSEKYPRKKPNILLISLGKRVLGCAIIQQIIFCFKRFFMPLSLQEVQRVAELARIGVSDAEARTVRAQLNDIFELIGRMQKVDTDGVEPMSHGQDLKLRLREDIVTERDQRKQFLSLAPEREQGLYLVPKVIE